MSDAALAHELGRLQHDFAVLAGVVAALEKRFEALERSAHGGELRPSPAPASPSPSPEEAERAAWIASLPCLTCKHPIGADVRHQIAQGGLNITQRSPGGLPLGCCRTWQIAVKDPRAA